MKQIFLLLFILLFLSCSNDVSRENEEDSNPPVTSKGRGQTFQANKSFVLAKLISKEVKNETNFSLNVKVIKVEEKSGYESIAVAGEKYIFTPRFYYDENNNIPDNKHNDGLKKLTALKEGDEFKAEISLDQSLGWIINKVLK